MNKVKYIIKRALQVVTKKQDTNLALMGKFLSQQIDTTASKKIREFGFKVYSQWDEDGIIQYLIKKLPVTSKLFVEFGVENYEEANTRFLMINDDWTGLVIDGSKSNIDFIKSDNIYWQHNLTALHSFITKRNINALISENIQSEEVGILSIDIDGNDYWIWQELQCIKPYIVVAEFNNLFGKDLAVTVPYQEDFSRGAAHSSHLFFGCSLKALVQLAKEKGYFFIGCNSKCMNAFFVRNEFKEYISERTIEEEFQETTIRESRSPNGQLSFLSDRKLQLQQMKEKVLYNISEGREQTIEELYLQ